MEHFSYVMVSSLKNFRAVEETQFANWILVTRNSVISELYNDLSVLLMK
jgi:hypothetical protein